MEERGKGKCTETEKGEEGSSHRAKACGHHVRHLGQNESRLRGFSLKENKFALCVDRKKEGVDRGIKKVAQHHVGRADHEPDLGQFRTWCLLPLPTDLWVSIPGHSHGAGSERSASGANHRLILVHRNNEDQQRLMS